MKPTMHSALAVAEAVHRLTGRMHKWLGAARYAAVCQYLSEHPEYGADGVDPVTLAFRKVC